MTRIEQIIPATDWFAVFRRHDPGAATGQEGERREVRAPVIAWALIPSTSGRVSTELTDRVSGLVVGSAGATEVVDESADDFVRYLHTSQVTEDELGGHWAFGV
jgi:hypothetical protein